jgi:hypothetical protein
LIAIIGTDSSQVEEGISVNITHLGCFPQKLGGVFLQHAKAIDPEMRDPKLSGGCDCVSKCGGKRILGDASKE